MQYLEILNHITYEKVNGNLEKKFNGKVRIDSRKIMPGDIFLAIKGDKVDGHDFIEETLRKGASCIISEREIDIPGDKVFIQVRDTKDTLLELASMYRKHFIQKPLIAITGSVGKTTTKEIISSLLEKKYKVLKTMENQNNHIGVPLTLLELDDSYDICVLELGMNHSGEIRLLSSICLPSDAVITNIGTSHIGNLGSKKNIFGAKMEIIEGMKNGGLFLNGDDEYLKSIENKSLFLVKCGLNKKNDIRATDIISTEKKLFFQLYYKENYYSINFFVPNESLIINILLAIAVAIKYQISIPDIIESLENYHSLESRNQIIRLKDDIILIDDSYNASLESLTSGLEMTKKFCQKKIIILGDILELGDFGVIIHKKISKLLKDNDKVILIGNLVKNIVAKNCVYCQNVEDAIKYIETLDLKENLIYVKGSHKIGLKKLVEDIKEKYQ